MTGSIETRKLKIIDSLVELTDEHILQLIEVLLISEEDFWPQLSEQQKARIQQAISELDAGQGIPHESVIKELRKKYSA